MRDWCILACLALPFTISASPAADLAVVNARVWTGNPRQPWAAAVAATGERILAAGSNEEIRALVRPHTRVIDGKSALVTPGFIDAHIHLFVFDRVHPLPPVFMRFLRDRKQVAERIAAYAATLPKGAWILGEDWTGAPPSRTWLDELAPDHPVWLTEIEGNSGIANTAALGAAGIALDTEPTGLIRGGPMSRVEAALIARSRERDDAILEKVMDSLLRAGITSVHHNNGWHDFLILRRLHMAGKLRVRVYASPPLPSWPRLRDYIAEHGRGDAWMHWGAVKGFGAIMPEPYYRWVSGALRAGLQVMVHTGAEVTTLLDVYARVRREQNLADPRFRVEHGHDMPADAIPRLSAAGAIASWQPPLLAHFDQRTGAGVTRPKNLFPCRALLQAGVKIAFGTDASPFNSGAVAPVQTLQMALERAAPDGTQITLEEALRAYTLDAAYAEFAEKEKGSLEPGKLADFVLFDRDFSRGPVHLIGQARVRMTVVGGRVAYE